MIHNFAKLEQIPETVSGGKHFLRKNRLLRGDHTPKM